MTAVQQAAIEAMDRGWAVFPVRGKEPATSHGLNDASKEHRLVPVWFERWPDRGLALATGKVSGAWVVDLDGPDAIERFAGLQAEKGNVQRTVAAKTARGFHVYFRMPPDADIRNSASKIAPGIDVRGTGGYVVLPPSPHPEGTVYAWAAGRSPMDCPIAEAPKWLVEMARETTNRTASAAPIPDRIAAGGRNATLASLAGSLRRRGGSRDAILAALRVENEQRCNPPLPESEVEQIADSVARYDPAPVILPVDAPHTNGNGHEPERPAKAPPMMEVIDRVVLERMKQEKLQPLSVVPTPWPMWNAACRGAGGTEGLAHGWHVIIGASSGAGKSLSAANITASAVRAGEHVCLISLEMSQSEVVTRLLAIYARASVQELEHGRRFDADAWDAAGDILAESGGSVRVNPDPIGSLEQIADVFDHYVSEGCRTFIVDYLQLAWVRSAETMVHQITDVSHTIRGLARKHKVLSIGLSQVNRATSGTGGELRKEGLLGGSSLENDADQVVLLGKPTPASEGLYRSEAKLDKNRHGPPAEWGLILDTRTLMLRESMPDEEPHARL